MQYVFNERREYIQTIEFKNTNPILNVEKINGFKEEGVVGTIVKKEFSYSFDNLSWSPWTTLTSANIQGISFNDEKHFYLHVRFTRSNVAAGNIRSFYILYSSKIDTDPGFPISSSDAGTLNGEPGSYYLDLYNHYGGLPNNTLNIVNLGGGAGVHQSTLYDPSVTSIYLRSITGHGAAVVTEEANRIVISLDASFSGEVNAGRNIGEGDVSIYAGKNLEDLLFRTFKAGTGVILRYEDASTITIDVSILTKDPSLEDIYSSLADISISLGTLESSINDIYLDLSTKQDIIPDGTYLKETSIGSGLVWNVSTNGFTYLDVSTVGGQAFTGDVSTTHVFYETFLDPSLAMPTAVGGIAAGTTVYQLDGDSVTTILNDLLFPTVQPTLNAPSATFVMSPTTILYEVSTYIPSLQFTTAFNQGSIYNGAVYQNVRSGACNNYNYTGTNLVDVSSSSSTNVQSFPYYIIQGTANQSWSCQVSYDQGPQPLDNKGNPAIQGPLAAGSVTAASTRTIEGVYPIFATTVDITTLTKQALVTATATHAPSSLGMLLVAETGGNKQKFDVPVLWTQANPLTGVQTYNTVSLSWEYQFGSAAASLTAWTVTDVTETVQGYVNNYKRYTYNSTDRNEVTIRLVI